MNLSSPEGFVLGLEGEWGSGKTSFVNLIIKALESNLLTPEIIKFSPWLISTRSALLGELFQSIAAAALKIPLAEDRDGAATQSLGRRLLQLKPSKRDANKRKLSAAINTFGNHISKLGKLADVAQVFGVPYADLAGKTFRSGGEFISSGTVPTLDKEKENLQSELRKLSRKIVIFIDDLDRLEPNEAIEIVRLVRAVVDFPNIVYVLCYSRKILVQSLAQALRLSDGEKYLDKIVQVTFSVPKPEDFDLRRMFKQKIEELFPEKVLSEENANPNKVLQRLNEVIDLEGGRTLSTPRDIARAINALQLYAIPILDRIDIADMTWLQLIRIRSHRLYEWIEEYMNTSAVLVSGATLSDHGKQKMKDDLFSIIDEEKTDKESVMHLLAEMLPGIEDNYIEHDGSDRWKLFQGLARNTVVNFIHDGRLGSPQHFRYYFALSKPSGAIEDEDFHEFLEKSEHNIEDAIQYFFCLSMSKRPQGGVWSEPIIDRLINNGIEEVPLQSIAGVILSFAFSMDRIAMNIGAGGFGEYWIWNTAKKILRSGLKRLSNSERSTVINRTFEEGEAIGWLTSLLRDETFAHGVVGERHKDEEQRIFTVDEFNTVALKMRTRYKSIPPETLMKTPQFLNILFGWLQLGESGEEGAEVKDWVKSVMSSDEGFITLLENMRGWSTINGEVVHPLKTQNLEYFCDVEAIDSRLNHISKLENSRLSSRAKALMKSREISKEI